MSAGPKCAIVIGASPCVMSTVSRGVCKSSNGPFAVLGSTARRQTSRVGAKGEGARVEYGQEGAAGEGDSLIESVTGRGLAGSIGDWGILMEDGVIASDVVVRTVSGVEGVGGRVDVVG